MARPGRTILVMDNGDYAAAFVRCTLGPAGYNVIEADDGMSALAKAKADRPDLIVVNICMPRHPGLYILRDLKCDPATHNIPVIILTSMGKRLGVSFSTEQICSFLEIEPDAFLETPADPDRLLEMTERLLNANSRKDRPTS